ncbi:MAG: hypothetical protein LLG06_03745 [Desulfobacteraceae bacterium]|nr:hypothetical protein [Desulfobacteraceae bacterium]
MRACDDILKRTLQLTDTMVEIADLGDAAREDVGCGVLYGLLRDSAFKLRKMVEEEVDAHIRKGWWDGKKKSAKKTFNNTPAATGQTITDK